MGAVKNLAKKVADPGGLIFKQQAPDVKLYNYNEDAFRNAESSKQLANAYGIQDQAQKQEAVAQQNQLQIRKDQLATAASLGQISQQQAALESAAIDEQLMLAQQQTQNIDALTAQSQGQGPSLSQNMLQDATDRNIKQIQGSVASQRGVPVGQAARTIAYATGAAGQQSASDAANMRLQEQMAAREQLTNALAQTRGQSSATGQGATSARMDATAKTGDMQGNVRSQDLNSQQMATQDKQYQQGLSSNISEADRAANMNLESLKGGGTLQAGLANQQASEKAINRGNEMLGNVGGAIVDLYGGALAKGAAGAVKSTQDNSNMARGSDEKMKTNISDSLKEINSFLDSIDAHKYEYKEEMKNKDIGGEGVYFSPMAQEIEKTQVGESMVKETPEGKVVDYGKAGGVTLASLSVLNERLKKLEKAFNLDENDA